MDIPKLLMFVFSCQGIDLAERMGVEQAVLLLARETKAKIIKAAPPGVDEARSGGDLGRLSSSIKMLLRRLSSLKGASIDRQTLRSFLDKIKSEISPEHQARLLKALSVRHPPSIASGSAAMESVVLADSPSFDKAL